jgi:hypothetical protein
VIKPGDKVTLSIWFVGIAGSSAVDLFVGTVSKNISFDDFAFTFTVTDIGEWYDATIGTELDATTYPNADPDAIGQIIPEVFGHNEYVKGLPVEAGAATTLRKPHDSTQITFFVTDTTRFPSSGSFFVGDEEVSYTGKTATTFTTCTRGVGGTTATSHSYGDAVLEDVATIKYLFSNHPVHTIENALFVPNGMTVNEAISVDDDVATGGYRTNDTTYIAGGQATCELDNLANIRRKVAIAVTQQPDQPITTQPNQPITTQPGFGGGTPANHSHDITGISQATIYGDAVDAQQGVSDPGNAYDQNFDTTEATLTYTSPSSAYLGLDFDYSGFDGLVIKQAVACIRVSVHVSSTVAKLRLPGDTYGLLNQDLNIGGGIATQKFIVSGLANETDWSKLDTLRIVVSGPGGPLTTNVYQMWWEISFVPTSSTETLTNTVSNRTTDAVSNRTTDAAVGGDSVADTIPGDLYCRVKGWKDDTPKHYTGTDGALIERPSHQFHLVLEKYTTGPVAHADIDLAGSFADLESNLPGTYNFGFMITKKIKVSRLFKYLEQQCFARFVWEAGKAKLNRILTSGSSDKSFNTEWTTIVENNRLPVKVDPKGLTQIFNDIEVKYNLDPILSNNHWFDSDHYWGSEIDSDTTSITDYGDRKRTFHAFAIGDTVSMADWLAEKLKNFYKDPKKIVIIPSWSRNCEVERGDLIDVTSTPLGLSDLLCEVINVDWAFPDAEKRKTLIPDFTLLEV